MSEIRITVNGAKRVVNVDDDTPLVWVLRDTLVLTGTKFGCGMGVCGSCTILENGKAVRSCQIPASEAKGRTFVTIEGLSRDASHPCQRAWIEEDVAQCGFCQPGMILTAFGLLRDHPDPRKLRSAGVLTTRRFRMRVGGSSVCIFPCEK